MDAQVCLLYFLSAAVGASYWNFSKDTDNGWPHFHDFGVRLSTVRALLKSTLLFTLFTNDLPTLMAVQGLIREFHTADTLHSIIERIILIR